MESDPEKQKAFYEKYLTEMLPATLQRLEQLYVENESNGDYFVGKRMTMADFFALSFLSVMVYHKDRIDKTKVAQESAPKIHKYWITRKEDFGDYFETRKLNPF
jgi:glutathione S-transferase